MNFIKTLIFVLIIVNITSINGKNIEIYNHIKIENQTNSKAVSLASKSLELDFGRKFGNSVSSKNQISILLKINTNWKEFDRYEIDVQKNKITFTGSDELGLIHGIYSFSEDILGIDPYIYFTDILPETEEFIEVPIGIIKSKPYTFKHRIFFINDEDLINGFQMEKIEYGFNLEFMGKLYETMLRLKMTGVIPSTLVFADEVHLELASDMGLYIAQHHAEPLGSVPLYWPKNIPYSWSTHKEYFVKFWRDAIERQKGKNVIWTLNFRGLLDRAFWDDDPSMSHKSSAEEKAKIVNEVIQTQYDLLVEVTKNKNPNIAGYLWGELGGLYRKGLIKYPKNTILLHSDSGYGVFNKKTWELVKNSKLKLGIYQHVSYHNRKTHLRINTIHPNTLHREMSKVIENNMTEMIVLNVGNFKEKIFGVQQIVNYSNNFELFKKYPTGDYYFNWYAKNKLNSENKNIIDTYKDFFTNQVDLIGNKERKPGDEFFFFYVERLLNMSYKKVLDKKFFNKQMLRGKTEKLNQLKGFASQMDYLLTDFYSIYANAEKKWEVSMQRAFLGKKSLGGSQLDFYNSDIVYATQKMYHLTGMSADFTKALNFYIKEDYHQAQLSAYAALEHSKKALQIEKDIETNGTGKFNEWYRNDETALTWRIEEALSHFLDHIKDLKYFNLPYKNRNSKTKGIQYKYEPFFKSKYQEELIYMQDAK